MFNLIKYVFLGLLLNSFLYANEVDGVKVLGEKPTAEEISIVKAAAEKLCNDKSSDEKKEQCTIGYYAQHNLVPILSDEPTDFEAELVRQGASIFCSDIEDDDERQQCAADYFAQHNLEEEPSCD